MSEENQSWADIEENESENESVDDLELEGEFHETQDSTEDTVEPEFLKFGDNDYNEFQTNVLRTSLKCVCLLCNDCHEHLNSMYSMLKWEPNLNHLHCMIDNIIRAYNSISSTDTLSPLTIAFTDIFFRLRHELLSKQTMISLNLPVVDTDMSFRDFGIDSNRTPDYIKWFDSTLVIIEVSASSNYERAAQSKGVEDLGFESKYSKELRILDDLSVKYIYIPVIFDMSNPHAKDYLIQLKKLENLTYLNKNQLSFLETLRKEFCFLSINMKSFISPSAAILFSNDLEIKPDHDSLKFLYENEEFKCNFAYREFCVSPQIYSRINNLWFRLLEILNSFEIPDQEGFFLSMNVKDYRLNTLYNKNAPRLADYINNYNMGNKIYFFKNLKVIIGNTIKPCTEIEQGVKFIEKVSIDRKNGYQSDNSELPFQKLPLIVDHLCINELDLNNNLNLDFYKEKLNIYESYNYKPNYLDNNYEEKLIRGMLSIDKSFSPYLDPDHYDIDLGLDLLAENKIDNIDIEGLMTHLRTKLESANKFTDTLPIKKEKLSMPFTLPLANLTSEDRCMLDFKDLDFLEELCKNIEPSNPFTTIVINKVMDDGYKFYEPSSLPSDKLNSLYDERKKISQLSTLYYKNWVRRVGVNNLKERSELDNDSEYKGLRSEISKLNKIIWKVEKDEKVKKNVNFVRLPNKNKKSLIGSKFNIEMSHFKDKNLQSTIEGVGLRDGLDGDFSFCQSIYENLAEELTDYKGVNQDLLIDLNVQDESRLLTDLKKLSINNFKDLLCTAKNSSLGHACSFVSRFAHSLMYYSQLPFNSDYIRVDNLGYKDCLLLVRGGKKIFKSKCSKLYRLFYPIHGSVVPWMKSDNKWKSSTEIYVIGGVNYAFTPWQLMHESVLNDSISFYTRVLSFTVLNLEPELNFKQQFNKISLNVFLAFHNRRKTEVFLSNMRYILLSTMGEFTGIQKIFDEFIGFNYDFFQSYLRGCIVMNYGDYFRSFVNLTKIKDKFIPSSIKKANLRNIFTNSTISSENDIALMIYSTFLMTKAPYQKNVERSSNLRSILEINKLYSEKVGLNLTPKEQFDKLNIEYTDDGDYINYTKKLFSNDFNFDAKYCSNLGVFCDSIYKNKGITNKLTTEWINILNKPWDKMATSTGLRGDPEDVEDFWGQKGYFVVYKEVLKDGDYCDRINVLLGDGNKTDDEKRKILRDMNKTQLDNLYERSGKDLLFHVVDKVQWRGSREIYVMDINTKSMQQPIEQYMAFLCKNLDNELISIPSDKRAQVIHHSIFEKDLPLSDLKMYYLTLDCSKWAPKSIFVKFCNMILSMECIPSSFKTHFLNYIEKLYRKSVYFNKGECKVLLNNPAIPKDLKIFLNEDTRLGGYYIKMPYSWVMGIFNYTSSFMHAVNQHYAGYLINKTSLLNFKEDSSLVMFAHSDDSGGRMSARTKAMISRNLMHYEINLKCCNHILSKKKSVVSRLYFEILSVIYIFKKLLALLPKFLGGLRFLPTDKGISQDLMQSYSKCIEVMIAGASFDVAYIVLKMYSMLVWRFYMNRDPVRSDYERPVQYMGMPDSHPISVLINGSSSDIVRILHTKGADHLCRLLSLSNRLIDCSDGSGPIRPFKFNIQIRNVENKFKTVTEKFSEHLNNWTIKNVNLNATPFDALNFLSKLSDKGFMGSMVNESLTRRMSRAFYFRNSNTLITKNCMVNFKKVIDTFNTFMLLTDFDDFSAYLIDHLYLDKNEFLEDFNITMLNTWPQIKVLQNVLSGPIKLLKYMDEIGLEGKDINKVVRTIKPTHLQIIKTGRAFSVDFDPSELVSFVKDPSFRWALSARGKLHTASQELKLLLNTLNINIETVDENTLLLLCRNYTSKDVKDIYLYSQIPSDLRVIKTYTGILSFLSTNSVRDMEISGLVLSLGRNISDPSYVTTQISNEIYVINTILNLLVIFTRKMSLSRLMSLSLNPVLSIDWGGGTVKEFLKWVGELQYSDVSYNFIKLNREYLLSIKELNEGTEKRVNASILKGCSYYVFLKQQSMKDKWQGTGDLLICVNEDFFLFKIHGDKVLEVYTNRHGKMNMQSTNYILDTLMQIGIKFNNYGLLNPRTIKSDSVFGFDHSGDLSNSSSREMNIGVPSYLLAGSIPFLENIEIYNLRFVHENLYILESDDFDIKKYKIYSLRPSLAGLIEITKNLFNKSDFESELVTGGLDNVLEFLCNEVLPDFGLEQYVNKNEFFNNFVGSKMFKIVSEVGKSDLEKIPKKPIEVNIPSPNGSLSRLITFYEEITGDKLLNSRRFINHEILKIRNEYPESFSLILTEKMVESYNELYTNKDKEEIMRQYLKASELDDKRLLKSKLINLMCYWGYSSIVNVIANFSFVMDEKNYLSFKRIERDHPAFGFYVEIFPRVLKAILKVSEQFNVLSKFIEFPIEKFNVTDFYETVVGYCFCLTYNTYKNQSPFYNISLNRLKFNNMILGLLKDDNFCEMLALEFKEIPILCTIPINYQSRQKILAMLNSLSLSWIESKENDIILYSNKILERLTNDIERPKKKVDELLNISLKPSFVYHHGLFERGYTSNFDNKRVIIRDETTSFFANLKLGELSEVEIPPLKFHNFIRPISEEFLESEIFEELCYLIKTGDYCQEEVEELLAEQKIQYKIPECKVIRGKGQFNKIYCDIKFIFMPSSENFNYANFVRQVGENVVLVSGVYQSNFLELHNSHVRLININGSDLLFHITCNKLLNKNFWDKFIGGDLFNLNNSVNEILCTYLIINNDGEVVDFNDSGQSFEKIFTTEGVKLDENKGFEIDLDYNPLESQTHAEDPVDVYQTGEVEGTDEGLVKLNKYLNALDNAVLEGKLLNENSELIKNKLKELYETKVEIDDSYYLKQMLADLGLGNIRKLLSKELFSNISKDEKVKIFQAPTVFGLAKPGTQLSKNIIKNKGLKAELYSLAENLVNACLSGTLTISKEMKKLAKSSFRIWLSILKDCRSFVENKKFFIIIFLTLLNDANESDDDEFEQDWQNLFNCIQNFMVIGEDESDDDMDILTLNISPFSTMKYHISGM